MCSLACLRQTGFQFRVQRRQLLPRLVQRMHHIIERESNLRTPRQHFLRRARKRRRFGNSGGLLRAIDAFRPPSRARCRMREP